MKPPSLDYLRKEGYKVKVTHYRITNLSQRNEPGARLGRNVVTTGALGMLSRRRIYEDNAAATARAQQELKPEDETPRWHVIQPCGGSVVVEIESPDGFKTRGDAVCSELENFKRKIGTPMAHGRAWKPFAMLGKQADGGYPIGAEIADKKTKIVGTVRGSRETGLGPIEYVIAWNQTPNDIFCINGNEIEPIDPSSYGAK